jgi:8-oxo-dGTP pyrophosphatase MutT (NUDIX family)
MHRFATDDDIVSAPDLALARAALDAVEDPSLAEVRERVLGFVDAHEDALLRSCEPGHLTGSALVVDPATERFLLLHHTKLRRWLQPGGHADGDGNLAGVARREAEEETGIAGLRVVVPAIDIDVHLVEPPQETPHLHYDVRYLVLTPPGAVAVGNHESTDLRWATIDDLDGLGCDPGVRRMAEAGLAALRAVTRPGEPGSRTDRSSGRSRPSSR